MASAEQQAETSAQNLGGGWTASTWWGIKTIFRVTFKIIAFPVVYPVSLLVQKNVTPAIKEDEMPSVEDEAEISEEDVHKAAVPNESEIKTEKTYKYEVNTEVGMKRAQSINITKAGNEVSSKDLSLVRTKMTAGPAGRRLPSSMRNLQENQAKIEQKDTTSLQKRTATSAGAMNVITGGRGLLAAVGNSTPTSSPLGSPFNSPRHPSSPVMGDANIRAKEAVFLASDEVKLKKSEENVVGPRLIRVRGKRPMTVRVVKMSISSLSDDDSFILEDGYTMYQWNGTNSSRLSKAKGADIARRINAKEKGTRARIIMMDQRDGTDQIPAFWKFLGSSDGKPIPVTASGPNDEIIDKLYRVDVVGEEQSGKVVEISRGKIGSEALSSSGVFVVDSFAEMYLWTGKMSPRHVRHIGAKLLADLKNSIERPAYTCVVKAPEGTEPILFKEKFWNFQDDLPIVSKGIEKPLSRRVFADFSMRSLYDDVRPVETMVDDAQGRIQMWYINSESKRVEFPESMKGHFFAGDSYIILYTYKKSTSLYAGSVNSAGLKDKRMIYFWQGSRSSVKKKGWSALLTSEMSREMEGETPQQMRVPQDKESQHFMRLFNDSIIVHQGQYSQFPAERGRDIWKFKKGRLYDVIMTSSGAVRAAEVHPSAMSLNSNHIFLFMEQDILRSFGWEDFLGYMI